jgi:hypothetical protein
MRRGHALPNELLLMDQNVDWWRLDEIPPALSDFLYVFSPRSAEIRARAFPLVLSTE